jgi:hypothetical protein
MTSRRNSHLPLLCNENTNPPLHLCARFALLGLKLKHTSLFRGQSRDVGIPSRELDRTSASRTPATNQTLPFQGPKVHERAPYRQDADQAGVDRLHRHAGRSDGVHVEPLGQWHIGRSAGRDSDGTVRPDHQHGHALSAQDRHTGHPLTLPAALSAWLAGPLGRSAVVGAGVVS